MANLYLEAVRSRRSNYNITCDIPISDAELETLIREVTERAPSPFNMQSARLVLLLGAEHDKLWQLVLDTLRPIVNDPEKFKETEEKIKGFASGYGTVLYFRKESAVADMQKNYPAYAENFGRWAHQVDGIVLYAVWTALAAEGIGASIQHYNPLIDEDVARMYDIPEGYTLVGQMPFGIPESMPEPRDTATDMLVVRK